jgi:phosphotransferase system enzyme I (PtsI)
MNKKNAKSPSDIRIRGQVSSSGFAIGPVFIHREIKINFKDSRIPESSVESECQIFRASIDKVIAGLRHNHDKTKNEYGDAIAEIFIGQIAILEDDIFLKEVEEHIATTLTNAEASTFTVFSKKREHFLKLENEYFKDRAFDIHDLKRQIIYKLRGETRNYTLNVPSIIVARDISPSDTIHFKRSHILGFITEVGGRTSHSAILARSLQIPSLSGVKNIVSLFKTGKTVVLDGNVGEVIVNPTEETQASYTVARFLHQKKLAKLSEYIQKDVTLRCGTSLHFGGNIEFVDDVNELKKYNIQDVGLYRSEGHFLRFNELPDEAAQIKEYTKLAAELGSAEVIIRTLDIGGDKIHSHFQHYREDNPFLGWRAIRLSLDEIGLFRGQIRAILLASANTGFKIMLPMITDVSEIIEAKQIIQQLIDDLGDEGYEVKTDIEIGVMIETPAAAMIMDMIIEEVDFVSIGTNDLTQYLLAVDRGNEKVSYLYQSHHPAVLRSIKHIITIADSAGKPVSVCGEMAGEMISFPILIGLGLKRFSMAPRHTVELKSLLDNLTLSECQSLIKEIEEMTSYIDVNKYMKSWFKQKFPDIKV